MTTCIGNGCEYIQPLMIPDHPVPFPKLLAHQPYLPLPPHRTIAKRLGFSTGSSCGTIQIHKPCPGQEVDLTFSIANCARPWDYRFKFNLGQIMPESTACNPTSGVTVECLVERMARVLMNDAFLNSVIDFEVYPVSSSSEEAGISLEAIAISWTLADPNLGTMSVKETRRSQTCKMPKAAISLEQESTPNGMPSKILNGQPLFYDLEADPTMFYVFPWDKARAKCLMFAGFATPCRECGGCDAPIFKVGQQETSWGYGYGDPDTCGCCSYGCHGGKQRQVQFVFEGTWIIPVSERVCAAGSHEIAISDDGECLSLISAGSRAPSGWNNLQRRVQVLMIEDEKVAIRFD